MAGTGLRKIMNSFGSPNLSKKSQQGQIMSQLGLDKDDFKQANGKLKSLADLMGLINDKTRNMGDANRMNVFHKFFGTTGQEAALILAKNTKQLKDLNGQVSKSQNMKGGGYIAQLSSKNLMSAQAQINIFKQAINGLGVSFATTVLPNITDVIKGVDKLLFELNDASPATKKAISYAIMGTAAIAPLSLAIGGLAKAIGFARTAWLLLSGSMKKGLPTTATESVVQQSAQVAEASVPVTGSRNTSIATESVAGTTRANMYGTNSISRAWKGSSILGKAAMAGVGIDIGANVVSAIHEGVNSKQGGKDLWEGAGTTVGGAIGTVFGPEGTVIGATIGHKIAGVLADSKLVRDTNSFEQRNIKQYNNTKEGKSTGGYDHLRTDPYGGLLTSKTGSSKGKAMTASQLERYNSQSGMPEIPGPSNGKQSKKLPRTSIDVAAQSMAKAGSVAGLNKSDTKYINQAAKLETQANVEWASSASKTYSTVKNTYGQLYQLAQDHANKQLSTDKKGYDYLVKQGLLSSNSAKSAYSADKSLYGKRLADLKSSMKKLVSAETSGGKDRAKAISKVNRQILSLTDAGGKRQQQLSRNLTNRTTKLTTSGLAKMVTASNKAYKSTVSSANKTYRTQVSTANARYKKEVSIAKNTKGLSDSQRKTIIANAQKQRDKTVANAETQRNDTVSWATQQRKDVVAQAEKQAGETANAFKVAVGDIASSIPTLIDSNIKAGLYTVQTKTSNAQAIKNNSNPTKNLKKGYAKVTGTAPKAKSASPFGGFAVGGSITKMQMAMVGEKGPELAYNSRTGRFRLLGSNGPTMAKLYAGERILNAKDTHKAMNGGMGAGNVLAGYASGTTKLPAGGKTTSVKVKAGNLKDPLADANKQTKKSMKSISKSMTTGFSTSTKKSAKSISQFNAKSTKSWKDIQANTKDHTDKIQKSTVADFDQMQKHSMVQMTQLHKGMNDTAKSTTSDFNTIFSRLGPYAHHGMGLAITSLNGGISGINSTLSQFGGNDSVLHAIHYAQGTKGPIQNDQLAVLNDAGSGPWQEAVLHGNGKWSMPNGRNALAHLRKGDQVATGMQTKQLASAGVLPHYAKGTGISQDTMQKLVEANQKNPSAAFNRDFTSKVGNKSSDALSSGLSGAGKRAANPDGVPWYKAMWTVISDAMGGGGSASAVVRYAKEHFSGKPYQMGGSGPTYYDCAGMVAAALAHYGVNIGRTTVAMQTSSGVQGLGKSLSNVRSGDLAIWGHGGGAAGHVGFIDSPSAATTFNETPPRARVTPLSYITALPLDQYYRVRGLKSDDTNKNSANKQLEALAKKQLGKNAIGKLTSMFADSGSASGPAPTGDHDHWMKQAGIPSSWWSAINEIVTAESGWNPTIHNGSGSSAYGIPQALPGSKMASAGSDWATNPITQLKWMKSYVTSRYGGANQALAFRKSHGWYGTGGRPPLNEYSHINEHGYELYKPDHPGTIVPHEQAKQIVTGGSKATKIEPHYDVKVEVNGGDNDDHILKLIKKALQSHDQELVSLVRAQVGDDAAYEFLG